MNRKPLRLILPAALVVLVGCTSSNYDQDFYDFNPEASRTRAMLDAQIAKGAAEDGKLSADHFDAGQLNGLGREKVEHIVEGSPRRTLRVYLDFVPATEGEGLVMLDSVRAQLAACGVRGGDEEMALLVRFGDPDATHRAGDQLAALERMHLAGNTTAPEAAKSSAGVFGNQ